MLSTRFPSAPVVKAPAPTADLPEIAAQTESWIPNWGVHLQPAGGVFVDRDSLYYFRLSGEAMELALHLARTQDFDSMVSMRCALRNADPQAVRQELLGALNAHPITAGWLRGDLGWRIRLSGSTDSYLPLSASLQLTNACNLKCRFCYASSGSAFPHELNGNDWLKVIERLSTAGVASLTLTGGEPTIVKEFPRIVSTASALVETVHIFTNGLAWPERTVKLVSSLGNVRCQVSIDGLAARHDALRGMAGSYQKALTTIRRLHEVGVHVSVAMTVSPSNHDEVEAVMQEVAEAGADAFRAGDIVPVGRGADQVFVLSREQRQGVNTQFARGREDQNFGMEVTGWDQCANGAEDEFSATGLPVDFITPGYLNWHVRADGIVTPCQVEEVGFGHILNDTIEEIGRPERLAEIRIKAKGCACIGKINVQNAGSTDLPFEFRPCCRRDD